MKLALLGRGRMGGEVSRLARESGHEIVVELDSASSLTCGRLPSGLEAAEVAIDFTRPQAVLGSVECLAAVGISVVVGTTGWYNRLDDVREVVDSHGIGLVYGANFSIGANVLLRLVEQASHFLDRFPEYDAYVFEHHHRHKADTPSGTALRLASTILKATERKSHLETSRPGETIEPSALHVVGLRAGSAFGRHLVGFDGPADSIEITHLAKSREGFARGALFAAEWVRGKKGLFEFPELFERRLA